jgi:alkaline phosphatase D
MPSGIAAGEVTDSSVVVWSRSDRVARMHVALVTEGRSFHDTVLVSGAKDFAGKVVLAGLEPGTRYAYAVWFSEPDDGEAIAPEGAKRGSFLTAPSASDARPIRFAWSGDLGGQNACRDAREGYAVFKPLTTAKYDFFLAIGDMIYSDTPCTAKGVFGNAQVPLATREATTLADYHAHWRYNREDPAYQAFLRQTSYFTVWDDHEVVNDWGPATDFRMGPPYVPGAHLMTTALRALLDYNPVREPLEQNRLYRRQRWGKHLELFFLDTRQYRDDNKKLDSAAHPKKLLGEQQIAWLVAELAASSATWKVVVCSVPLSIPTGPGPEARDGFADEGGKTGFEQELKDILKRLAQQNLSHTVWITTDVHFASHFSYAPFPEKRDFVLDEFSAGPLSAGFFPKDKFDSTFRGKLTASWANDNSRNVTSYEQARALFNFGEVSISEAGALSVAIVNADGQRVAEIPLSK